MEHAFAIYDSPIGGLMIEVSGDKLINLEIYPYGDDLEDDTFSHPNEFTDMIYAQIMEYINGERTTFNIEIGFCRSTPFQIAVYNELMKIPYGETRSYKEIATAIGNPKASRAVGTANNHNPIHIIIPCHRVIGSRGALTGYAAGINTKADLLKIEKR
ncbi:MAG: methylated-DNA--[protein]-cysteine S-methyltransferase [Bacteroidales bacterium]